jgi:cation/acetate symporter
MIYDISHTAIILFLTFVGFVLGLSFYAGAKTKTASGYFAAGGTVHWFVNGVAFAGDYLSAASFLGICGMIAISGFDGFIYSVGYLAGWVVALFVIAEPMKRLGKFTFTDALDSKFNSKSIQLMAAISTLMVSTFYLIPQMVGAGVLVKPLLGLEHWAGVSIVGAVVIFIVAKAGMTSTTYVQFLKGGLLIAFSTLLSFYLLKNGFTLNPESEGSTFRQMRVMTVAELSENGFTQVADPVEVAGRSFTKLASTETITMGDVSEEREIHTWWELKDGVLTEALSRVITGSGEVLYNGAPKEARRFFQVGSIVKLPEGYVESSPVGPLEYLNIIENSDVALYPRAQFEHGPDNVSVWYQNVVSGKEIMKPGQRLLIPKDGKVSFMEKLNFVSLMLALFLGTASLPHILIRYYTVPSQKDARKSTIVAVASIGFFYILTLYLGLGAMTSGIMDVGSDNMSAPLLAKGMSIVLFSVISAIAFATVLGTVAGLIVAASGAVAHDLLDNYMGIKFTDEGKVRAGKIAAIGVGAIAIVLGILFEGLNVSFLVAWAFSVAASANLPSIIMLLFWKKTTAKGIAASILTGVVSSLSIILMSPSMFERYGLDRNAAPFGLDNPGIISIPLAFLALIVVSLMTQKENEGLQDINDIH